MLQKLALVVVPILPSFAFATGAAILEQTIAVPVAIEAPVGRMVRQDIVVTIVHASVAGRRPFLVLHHGRGATAEERSRLGVASFPANARYFADRGFVVLIPTRVGYGLSGGPDVEYTGECALKNFDGGIAVAVSETRQLLAYAARLPFVDTRRGLVVGESFGGLVAIAVAAAAVPGVVGSVNVAGGDGGDSVQHVDEPCHPELLAETLARYGSADRVPTLWMYSANDRFWGAVYPRHWYNAFVRAGGRGEFVALPADKNNGHFIFNRNAESWRPAFERFTAALGLSPPAP